MSGKRLYDVLVRVYTPRVEEVPGRVERALGHARQIIEVYEEFPALQRLTFLVPSDYDCGHTCRALRARLRAEKLLGQVEALEFPGHHSCEVLNQGLARLSLGTNHILVISGKAMSYLTAPNLRALDEAFAKGAKVVGLAVDELREVVLSGRIQNTFAAWEVEALLGAGGFDCKTGVEEMAPLIHLAQKFGRCIVPIDVGAGALDLHESATAQERHKQVMATKIACQQAECARLDSDFEFIRRAVMP